MTTTATVNGRWPLGRVRRLALCMVNGARIMRGNHNGAHGICGMIGNLPPYGTASIKQLSEDIAVKLKGKSPDLLTSGHVVSEKWLS